MSKTNSFTMTISIVSDDDPAKSHHIRGRVFKRELNLPLNQFVNAMSGYLAGLYIQYQQTRTRQSYGIDPNNVYHCPEMSMEQIYMHSRRCQLSVSMCDTCAEYCRRMTYAEEHPVED